MNRKEGIIPKISKWGGVEPKQALLKPKPILLSLAVSLIPAAASHYTASATYASVGGAGIVDMLPILAATSVCAALVCIFLLSLLFETAKGAAR
ncbi:MAG: hypothetical protein LBL63_04455, partial [Clostridiales Family XIII bacterium]|nr:hypothetical protein [Clostridiales Family XIII bacterium]